MPWTWPRALGEWMKPSASSSSFCFRPKISTRAPCPTSMRAVARPMPAVPPLTTIALFARLSTLSGAEVWACSVRFWVAVAMVGFSRHLSTALAGAVAARLTGRGQLLPGFHHALEVAQVLLDRLRRLTAEGVGDRLPEPTAHRQVLDHDAHLGRTVARCGNEADGARA